MSDAAAPRVKGNDWGVLEAADDKELTPHRSVSIVIPAYRAQRTLPYTLAALQAQTYPSHLLEVLVVTDGGDEQLVLPECRPDNARILPATTSWGRANACREGAAAAEGEVIHWLDADMVPGREEVARQMRWHHLIDHAVVVGHKLFVDADDLPAVADLRRAVVDDRLSELLAGRWTEEHGWVEAIWRRTDDLKKAGFRAFHVHVGATGSVSRELYFDAGGMDPSLKLGEDIELGYRLTAKGAVFVADRTATSWHLGRSHLMQHEQQVQRYNAPFIAERVPDFRKFRQERGRSYRVPYVEVVVDTDGHTWEQVKYTVDGVLEAVPGDVRCLLVGRWSQLSETRRHPLQDALLDKRLLAEEYASDARVRLVETVAPTAFPAQYRLHLPAGWRPGERTLDQLTKQMQKRVQGLRSIFLPDTRVVRLERTAAFERALRLVRPGEDLDDVVEEVSGTWWSEGTEEGFQRYDPDAALVTSRIPREEGQPAQPLPQPRARQRLTSAARLAVSMVKSAGRPRR